jgi:hypothetical protein
MICGDFTFGSYNEDYCRAHEHRYPPKEIGNKNNIVTRTIQIRYYPREDERKKLAKYFGCSRKTYNMCVEGKEERSSVELRDRSARRQRKIKIGI